MAISAFLGRQRELELMDRLWDSPKAELMILYGRRRVGKTRLLTHWMAQHEGQGIYWMAEPTSAVDQLRSFSQAVANFQDPDEPAPLDFTYANWEQALRQVALLARGSRLALFIDEITYLMDSHSAIIGTLQKVWDHKFANANILLGLSGSQMGVMQKDLLSYQAPLYGRAGAQVQLPPLPFGATNEYFPNYSAAERVLIYSIWGGIPAYWERLDPNISVIENLHLQLDPTNTWLLDEPRLLLQDFIVDMNNYIGIMRAMAQGAETLGEIGKRNGLQSTHVISYLDVLRDTGFVKRTVPVSQRNIRSRLGHYQVTDPFLRFYYRFLAPFQSRIALGQQRQVVQSIREEVNPFLEKNTWRELCREWLMRAADYDVIPLPVEAVGGEWKRSFEVDVVGIHEESRSIVLGCSLWNEEPAGAEHIEELLKTTASILNKNEDWQVYYLGFAANGWQPGSEELALKTIGDDLDRRARTKWRLAGVRLLDLAQVDEDLSRWPSPMVLAE